MENFTRWAVILIGSWSCAVSLPHLQKCSVMVDVSCDKDTTVLEMDKDKIESCLRNEKCEHGLYNQDGDFLTVLFDDAIKTELIKNVSGWKVTMRACLLQTRWQFHCFRNPECREVTVCYRNDKSTSGSHVSPPKNAASHHGSWLAMLIRLGAFVIVMGY